MFRIPLPRMLFVVAMTLSSAMATRAEASQSEVAAYNAATYTTCTVEWSHVQWDDVGHGHYVIFTNHCDRTVYCYVKVTRSGRTTTYGRNVAAGQGQRINVGRLSRDDIVECGVE